MVDTAICSPVFFEKLAEYCLELRKIPSTLKQIFLGGAPVFPRLAKKLAGVFPEVRTHVVYGSTEAEPISLISLKDLLGVSGKQNESKKGLLVGKPVDGIFVKIIGVTEGPIDGYRDFTGLEMEVGEIGEICVTGPFVLTEYYNSEEARRLNKFVINGSVWHRTGDAGYLDREGNLYLMGRVGNRFWHNGREYYLFPLEEELSGITGVSLGTVVKIGETLLAILEMKKEKLISPEDIREKIRDLGIPFDRICYLKKIPRDPGIIPKLIMIS